MADGTWLLLASLCGAALFFLGTPIFLVMGLWVLAAHLILDYSLANIGNGMFEGLNSFALLAAPLFILTGDLIAGGGIARRITDFTLALLGWLRGGLGMASLTACGIFAAISGSNSATTATIGSIVHPTMVDQKYGSAFSAATASAGGCVGIIIPPSILFIIYGYLNDVPVSELFLAGIIPGLMMVFAMMLACWFVSRRKAYGIITPFTVGKVVRTTPGVSLAGFAVLLVLWGIYAGVFSPTEAASVTVAYCLFAGLFLTRELKLSRLPDVLFRSAMIVGIVIPLVAVSIMMQQMFAVIGVSRFVADALGGIGVYWIVMAICMAVVLVAGTLLESVPLTIILAPILAPVAIGVGADPFHFAVVFMVGGAIGFITPPFGLNLFVAATITGVPYLRIARAVLPYLVALLSAWLIIAMVPQLTLYMVEIAGLGGGGLRMK